MLIDAGLPKPQTQIKVRDDSGYAFARVDMGYEEFKVGVEYDGIQHWDPKVSTAEIDRHARLLARGWRIVRVSAEILRYRQHTIVRRTCDALAAAGAQWPVIARFSSSSVA